MRDVFIFGAGGHAVVVAEVLRARSRAVAGFISDDPKMNHRSIAQCVEPGELPHNARAEFSFIVGIGANSVRERIVNEFKGGHWASVIHPSSIVSESVQIGEGSVLFHNSVVQAFAEIGRHCIVNTSASVDHDCVIGDFVHIAPNSTLCGAVRVGDSSFIGAGATILPGITIGSNCIVGAGTVVTKDVIDGSVIVGVPGSSLK